MSDNLSHAVPTALTIAGSDSGGGAGIQADLKSFSALGVYGASVITAVTAQNTQEVTAVHGIPDDIIAAQIRAVVHDIRIDAIKVGMLKKIDILGKWFSPENDQETALFKQIKKKKEKEEEKLGKS